MLLYKRLPKRTFSLYRGCYVAMVNTTQRNGGLSPTRVSGAASRAVVRLLSDHGIPANELVVTGAERHGDGEAATWVVSVLRGRHKASHAFSMELVGKVLARGPCKEWYTEVSRLLEAAGLAFPA